VLEHKSDIDDERDPLLVVILGPTASGKTVLSLALAEELNGEIVSCDSVAVYRGFEIGTAKPTREERARVPHHMIDIAAPDEEITAGEYARRARATLGEIKARGKLPIVVGGTGLYLRALVNGLFAGPERSEELREKLRSKAAVGGEELHRVLSRLDPEAAKKIHPNDTPKLIRAIEVCIVAGEQMSEMWQRGRDPLTGFRRLRVGLDPARSELYERINLRCAQMFERGLVEETRELMKRYRPPDFDVENDSRPMAKALGSLGYSQAVALLRAEMSLAECIEAAKQGHRNYAKRQMTWFRRESEVKWYAGFGDDVDVRRKVLERVCEELKE
jgi:tRNA dimethylallyltransferase